MAVLRRVCVFCGSKHGVRPEYTEAARATGTTLVAAGIDLVYGGGRVGLMGEVADAVLAAGGRVIGVIPEHMADREIAHDGLTELRIVGSMHERKALMYELSDGFVALPGGIGTLEELFEITTWSQLGLHTKPTGLLDVEGFYSPLVGFLDQLVTEGFVAERHRRLLRVAAKPADLLGELAAFPD
ncbi:MAG TPA: TIGR00730 family Rossman fold protein [Acidimicrobiia bacterium]|nr:TIGR00730 family Rossman fold protein [Acidimicrobiia bacterium]